MLTLQSYLGDDPSPDRVHAATLIADANDHAMAGATLMLDSISADEIATGHALEGAVLRRAARWLQTVTEEHRRIVDDLVTRSGDPAATLRTLKCQRAKMTESREAGRPLYALAEHYLRWALEVAALKEATELLDTRSFEGVATARAVLHFFKLNKGDPERTWETALAALGDFIMAEARSGAQATSTEASDAD